jgi:hypothetical protein
MNRKRDLRGRFHGVVRAIQTNRHFAGKLVEGATFREKLELEIGHKQNTKVSSPTTIVEGVGIVIPLNA